MPRVACWGSPRPSGFQQTSGTAPTSGPCLDETTQMCRADVSSYLSKEVNRSEALNKVKLEAGVGSGKVPGSCIFCKQKMFRQGQKIAGGIAVNLESNEGKSKSSSQYKGKFFSCKSNSGKFVLMSPKPKNWKSRGNLQMESLGREEDLIVEVDLGGKRIDHLLPGELRKGREQNHLLYIPGEPRNGRGKVVSGSNRFLLTGSLLGTRRGLFNIYQFKKKTVTFSLVMVN